MILNPMEEEQKGIEQKEMTMIPQEQRENVQEVQGESKHVFLINAHFNLLVTIANYVMTKPTRRSPRREERHHHRRHSSSSPDRRSRHYEHKRDNEQRAEENTREERNNDDKRGERRERRLDTSRDVSHFE